MRPTALTLTAILSLMQPVLAADLTLDVREHVLPNGMKILMMPQPGVPRVICHVFYKVGSINERPGITGLAHLLEHMMFKGTKTLGVTDFNADAAINRQIDELMERIYHERYWRADGGDQEKLALWQKQVDSLFKSEKQYVVEDEIWKLYMENGGSNLNASTGNEFTGYYVTLPSNKVELQMLIESDRMRSAYFREFYAEKGVVMEERRLGENLPGVLFNEQVNAAFYAASPYHWSLSGWMDDLRKCIKQDLTEFHDKYYIPNNAVAIYLGDFRPETIIALAEEYFGRIPKGPDPEPIRTLEPPQYCEKRLYGEGPGIARFQAIFHTPPEGHPDELAIQVLATVLDSGGGFGFGIRRGDGRVGGRLNTILVEEKQVAVNVSVSSSSLWYVGALYFNATPRVDKNVQPEDLEKEVWTIIDDIKKNGVTESEIQMAKNRREANFLRSLLSPQDLGLSVGVAELNRGWRAILTDLQDMKKVTNDDFRRVAARYLVRDNSLAAIYRTKM